MWTRFMQIWIGEINCGSSQVQTFYAVKYTFFCVFKVNLPNLVKVKKVNDNILSFNLIILSKRAKLNRKQKGNNVMDLKNQEWYHS